MKRIGLLAVLILGLTACFQPIVESVKTSVAPATQIGQIQTQVSAPKARVAVEPFTDGTSTGVGAGVTPALASLMKSTLMATNQFKVLERGVAFSTALREQDLAQSGRIASPSTSPSGQVVGADLILMGRVTSFENTSSAALGVGLGIIGSFFGPLGALAGAAAGGIQNKRLVLEVQMADVRTSEVIFSSTIDVSSTDWGLGGLGLGIGSGGIGGAGGAYQANTPQEKVTAMAVQKAVEELVSKLPRDYFKH